MKKTLIATIVFLLMVGLVMADEWPVCVDMIAPDAPTGLSMSGTTLTWTAANDEPDCSSVDYYEIYRNDVLLGKTSSTSFNDASVADGTYTYKVIAYDVVGNEGAPATKSFTIGSTGGGGGGGGGTGGGGGGGGIVTTTTTQNSGGSDDSTTTTTINQENTNLINRLLSNLGGNSDDNETNGTDEGGNELGTSDNAPQTVGYFAAPLSGGNLWISLLILLLLALVGYGVYRYSKKGK